MRDGKVEPVQEAEVRARLDGRIVEIPEPGTDVSKGDVILRIGAIQGPRNQDLIREVSSRAGQMIGMTVLRDGVELRFDAKVSRQGRIGITLAYAWDTLVMAMPLNRIAVPRTGAPAELFGVGQ